MQIIHYLELLRYEWNLGPNFGLVLDIVLSEEACTAFCRLRLSFCIPLNSQTPGSPSIWGMLLALGSWLSPAQAQAPRLLVSLAALDFVHALTPPHSSLFPWRSTSRGREHTPLPHLVQPTTTSSTVPSRMQAVVSPHIDTNHPPAKSSRTSRMLLTCFGPPPSSCRSVLSFIVPRWLVSHTFLLDRRSSAQC